MRLHPFRDVRSRLLLIVLFALGAALAAATVGFNLLFASTASRDANTLLRTRAATELALIRVERGEIHVTEGKDDPVGDSRVWVFRGEQAIESARASPETDAAARSLIGGPRRFLDVKEHDLRLYAVPIVENGRRAGTLVTGISLAPYEQTQHNAFRGTVALAILLLILVGVAVWWLLRSALRPVSQMTEQAEAWSEHDLDRRFQIGEPHDELTRLAATLDGLLGRLAASLRHERRFSAEVSHELRTPLAKLMAEAELALRRERSPAEYRESIGVVLENARQIERIVETLVTAARQAAQPQGVADAAEVAEATVSACSGAAEARGISLQVVRPPTRLRVGVDRDLVERILHPVVENACRYGNSEVRVSVRRDGSTIVFAVDDDGPGVRAEESERIFEPAVRGSAGRSSAAGAGLGLALARRLARAASGDVEAQPGSRGRFCVRLPAA